MKGKENNTMENDDTTNDVATEATNETALATSNEQVMANYSPITADGFDLSALPASEQLEIVREIYDAEAQLEASALPQVKSSDIIGVEINILDAAFKSIPMTEGGQLITKTCVSFVCEYAKGEHAGEQFTVLKGSNPFNDLYANRFSKLRGIMSRPLNGYEFVTDPRYSKAGHDAIVLRRVVKAGAAGRK